MITDNVQHDNKADTSEQTKNMFTKNSISQCVIIHDSKHCWTLIVDTVAPIKAICHVRRMWLGHIDKETIGDVKRALVLS